MYSMLHSLKDLEKYDREFVTSFREKFLKIEEAILFIEKGIIERDRNNYDRVFLDQLISDAQDQLNAAKKELGSKRREVLSLRRQLGDIPVRIEINQYEHQFSGLKLQIQEKLHQTRQYYDTYNALMEMKELMLKELPLLNSISSQLQGAILESSGRMKLMDSMENILKVTQLEDRETNERLQAQQPPKEEG
ncbi:paramyosin-like protein [Wolffia australiana]